MKPLEPYRLLIREFHLDSYGHVNNATYLTLFEEARWEQVTTNGYGYQKVQELKVGPVVLAVSMKFMKELKLREWITITSEVTDSRGLIAKMRQKMIKENGDIACEADFSFGLFDLEKRKLIPATAEWQKALGQSD